MCRAARSRKSSVTAAGDKSFAGAAVTSNSDDEICDVTDDVSEGQAEALPLVSDRPIRAAPAVEHRRIAVGDLWSYVTDKKLSTVDSLKDEYDVWIICCISLLVDCGKSCNSLAPVTTRMTIGFDYVVLWR